jgi:hypothetical protein
MHLCSPSWPGALFLAGGDFILVAVRPDVSAGFRGLAAFAPSRPTARWAPTGNCPEMAYERSSSFRPWGSTPSGIASGRRGGRPPSSLAKCFRAWRLDLLPVWCQDAKSHYDLSSSHHAPEIVRGSPPNSGRPWRWSRSPTGTRRSSLGVALCFHRLGSGWPVGEKLYYCW